jgi:starch synthase
VGWIQSLRGNEPVERRDKITTVSPTYADEIRTEQYGESLEKSLEYRGGDLIGILNGIDINSWNPKDDSALEHPIYQNSPEKGKFSNKVELLKQMKLPLENNIPLLGVVSRLFHQKGLDMLAECLPQLTNDQKFQLIVLGSGEKALEDSFLNLAKRYSNKISIQIGFDDKLARRIFAGSDFFIMPSRFEPCGLAQQYAMRYGSIPVARKTGGLADTIIDLEKDQRHGNGLLFQEPSPDCLRQVINRAIELFQNPEKFKSIRKNALNSYFSWDLAAKKYENVYQWALQS